MSYSTAFSHGISILLYVHMKTYEEMYDYLSTKKIAEEINVPVPTVVKVIRSLIAEGLISTKEGAKGGIALSKSAKDITLLDIFLAVEKGNPLFKWHTNFKMKNIQVDKLIDKVLYSANEAETAMHKSLAKVTLEDLVKDLL